jgi:putative phage-type endonuclease
MIIHNCVQGTIEWQEVRLGVPSASCFDCIVTMKGEPSKQAEKYMFKLAGEKVAGKPEDTYSNDAMKRGVELEDQARQMYQIMQDCIVDQVGFCVSEEGWGCSPDGLVGDDGMIEIKCPSISTHVKYLLDNKLPSDYYQQTQGQLFVTGRKWNDFVSFYPGIKPLIVRVYPDVEFHQKLKAELVQFVAKLNQTIKQIS